MPNPLAYTVLALWPIVTLVLFLRFPADRALILSMLAGYLFLPEPPAQFDFPLLAPLSKHNIPALTAFVIALWMYGQKGPLLPASLLGKLLCLVFVFSPILTVITNTEPVFFGDIGLPGLTWKDAAALVQQQALYLVPFLMARRFLASGGSQEMLLKALMWGGLAYSLPMLIEIRLSPQLNNWIYGYFQHYFGQSVRFGGYRPVVFLYHGLWVAFYMVTAVVAAWALWRHRAQPRMLGLMLAVYLTVILILTKSLGALIFAVALVPCVLFLKRFMQINVALLIGFLAVGYPLMKGAQLVPEDQLLAAAQQIDADRAASLEFRFNNENILLNRAAMKPVFGWGSWGRNHILNPVTGAIETVTDGRWIIAIGVYGWVGFLAEFGLLVFPILLLWREALMGTDRPVSPYIAPISLLLAINIFDMIPNATLTPLTWLVAGALTGYAEQLRAQRLELKRSAPLPMRWRSIL
ncbi:hypothetical protein KUH32_07235 [Thalassococcus sp. CAU 1522]|uniref:O-antigen ligase like membrane protein n=1 Tax=Thalassococcus arenae TaxID=2851652 RepID=A0ABS6N6C7_9RHOB|nr:hypothetical protein [Thalassococcus arenae]MBV2359561.1 hypothetical protein [Thalassococcus arenae]